MHPELQGLLDAIDACERRAEEVVAGLDDVAVNWRPPGGGWSVAQCLHHLAVTSDVYLDGCVARVEQAGTNGRPFGGLGPTAFGRWFVRSLEPPVRMKVKTFRAAEPAVSLARDQVLAAYRRSHEGYRALVRAAAATDVNRIVVPNAFQPRIRMRMSTILLVIPAHERRHLWQADNVRRAWLTARSSP